MPEKTKIHTVYKVDGKRVPSVTTILGILDKPALLHWAWQCGIDGLDYRKVRDDAGDIGTLAHYLIMCGLTGETPDVSEYSTQNIEQAEICLIKYWDWEKSHTIEPILIKSALVCEECGFGGTIDFYGTVDGALSLIDFKTGKALYPEHWHQVAAYRHLLGENSFSVESVRILRIGRSEDEGFEEHTAGDLINHWEIFDACNIIYSLRKDIKREA